MKKLFFWLAAFLISTICIAQSGSQNVSAIKARLADSTQAVVPSGWGYLSYFSQSGKWRVNQNGTWYDLIRNTGMTNPMTTAGDIIVGGVGGTPTRLGIGASNTVLHGGSSPSYSAVSLSSDVSGLLSITKGGTGSNLSDPNANRLWGWDDTDNSIGFWTIGSGLTYNHSTHTLNASGGISNSAANNELMKSDGTNAIASGIFSTSGGNIDLGTGLSGTIRGITADGSGSNVGLQFAQKGTGIIAIGSAIPTGSVNINSVSGANIANVGGTTNSQQPASTLLYLLSTGTPAIGIGTGLRFVTQTVAGQATGATIGTISTNVSSGTESFDFVFNVTAAGSPAEQFRIMSDGRIYGKSLHNNSGSVTGTSNQYIASGSYTPTITSIANVSSTSSHGCQWIRVGNVVTVSGSVDITPTATTTDTQIRISLPIASNLVNDENCSGTTSARLLTQVGAIWGDTTNDAAYMEFQSATTSQRTMYFSFQYLIN